MAGTCAALKIGIYAWNALEHVPAEIDVLLFTINRLVGRSDEQHAMIDCMKHLPESRLDSSAAAKETGLELLPLEIVSNFCTQDPHHVPGSPTCAT